MVLQDPLRAKLREILPNATESELNRALKHLKSLNIDLQQLEHMETSRVQELFRSDTPKARSSPAVVMESDIRDRKLKLFQSDTPTFGDHGTILKKQFLSLLPDKVIRNLNHPGKKQNRNFIEKIKNVFHRKK